MEAPDSIADLLFKYIRNALTPDENLELEEWKNLSPENRALFEQLTNREHVRDMIRGGAPNKDAIWSKMVQKAPELELPPVRKMHWKKMIAAAAVLVFLFGSGYWYLQHRSTATPPNSNLLLQPANDVAPGADKAILTLANGQSVILDSLHKGRIEQGTTSIVQSGKGEISYTSKGQQEVVAYNTLSTPRGGQYVVVLPDGTRVWLNAASSLKYPTAFSGKARVVELFGEAYFEVAKNAAMPFKVGAGKIQVEVLGTHFNVMAYPDEDAIATTLLEGSVKINGPSASTVITPGDQARVDNTNAAITVKHHVDTDVIVGWKNGMTVFRNADLKTIMRTLSRWYDVDVVYRGNIPEKKLGGGIPRNTNLAEVLNVLGSYDIHVKLEGKQITVMP